MTENNTPFRAVETAQLRRDRKKRIVENYERNPKLRKHKKREYEHAVRQLNSADYTLSAVREKMQREVDE